MWHIPAKLSSVQSRQAVTKNGCNVHDCVKVRRGFSQLSFMYVLFSFNIFFITHFWVMLSFQPPLDHNTEWIIFYFKLALLQEHWALFTPFPNFVFINYYFTPCEFFAPANASGLSLESKWQQVSRTLLSILAKTIDSENFLRHGCC